MHIRKQVVAEFLYPYAISVFDGSAGKQVIVASESSGPCVFFDADGSHVRQVWEGPGGTMTLWPIPGKTEFLATHEFFKGFNAKTSHVVHVKHDGTDGFSCKTILAIPYLHRFCVVQIKGEHHIVGTTLCDDKAYKEDWSTAGGVYVGKLSEDFAEPVVVHKIIDGITKNHGMYHGPHDDLAQVVIVTGVEGAFELIPPEDVDGEWAVRQLLDVEVSEIRCYDIDGDGVDELITIERFHGDRLNIYRLENGTYRKIFSYPIAFGHALWCGKLFGKHSILLGYKDANAALMVMQPGQRDGSFTMTSTLIDEFEQVANLDVWIDGEEVNIYAACSTGKVIRYILEP